MKNQRENLKPPSLSLPKGGGAIRGIGEKFTTNPATGTGTLTVPIPVSRGRADFTPELTLFYDSGSGNGPFGIGWTLSLPSITRKTDKGLPKYRDNEESDVFILSGAEDLVPILNPDGSRFEEERTVGGETYLIHRYRPRVEGLFARIERWTRLRDGDVHWRSISRDNVLTIYGKDAASRIADPEDTKRVFSWLISEVRDDKGNAILYIYKGEDSEGIDTTQIHERNRTPQKRSVNRYIKRILYGNRVPLLDDHGNRPHFLSDKQIKGAGWMFEVVFDYDEGHYEEFALNGQTYARAFPEPSKPWSVRIDPFSIYRAGFEIRTYRRCQRILIFHHISGDGGYEGLVRSLEFDYDDLDYTVSEPSTEEELIHQGSTRFASFLRRITQSGYVRRQDGKYLKRSLPPLEFEYSKTGISEEVLEIEAESLENLPIGIDGNLYQWVDLDGDGIAGILTEQAGEWFYKPNLGEGRFGPLRQVSPKPSLSPVSRGRGQFIDLAGDGKLDLVELGGATSGFYERSDTSGWERFRPFTSVPNIPWKDPNLRLVDLTGDGRADVLITEEEVLIWYLSLGEAGFAEAERVQKALDEEEGPRVVFADGTQTLFIADMSGDGLPDLVRIRNGEVCYWPNLGYGRFGAKVTMDNSPWFDTPDQFDPKRIRMADIDGSGTTDIIYLHREGVRLYFNQSGNRISAPYTLKQFPPVDNFSSVTAVDLLGTGTACLVWSSPLPGSESGPLRYVDLMGGQKPHLLLKVFNNLGAETKITYAPSTKFYLKDKEVGRPWITKLPFPVHVVERVETYDHISRNRFVTRYAYHDGYFDGEEREFRGFGMVEQWDTEEYGALTEEGEFPQGDNWDETSHIPPVYTKTWFHTGAYLGRRRISRHYEEEYYREPELTPEESRELLLPDMVLPEELTAEEEREACRALKGKILRQEVYALDRTDREPHPYTVLEQNFTVRQLQPRGSNRHAVFFVHSQETITYHYERNPADPRILHTITIEVDDYGNVLKEVSIGYGRRAPDPDLPSYEDQKKQSIALITYTENDFTNAVDTPNAYRTPLIAETRTYELTGYTPTGPWGRFRASDFVASDPINNARLVHVFDSEIPYESQPTSGRQRRLIERVRTLYRRDDLTGLLGLGQLEPLALPGETYQLAFTRSLLTRVFQRNGEILIEDPEEILGKKGGYVDLDGDGNWWVPSGRVFYSPNSEDSPVLELAYAQKHFFLPLRFQDPFGQTTKVLYDNYDLLVVETRDPLDNITQAINDYRVLQPRQITDPNGNRSEVAFDALGMVVGTALIGKDGEGDSLEDFRTDLTEAEIMRHLADPLSEPHTLLQQATTRTIYDLFAYMRTKSDPKPQPAVVWILKRETHESDLEEGEKTSIQHTFSYSDGFGREIQKKTLAEPGPVPRRDEEGQVVLGSDNLPVMTENAHTRWVGSGWTVFNNKGKAVRQYEPFFTDTHRFEFNVRIGVSPILFYDPLERVVATLHPNHTWEKVVFTPWRQETWDVNDTVLLDPATDPDVGDFFRRLPEAEFLPTWHALRTDPYHRELFTARKTELHAGTPTIVHLDVLGRAFLIVAHNRFERERDNGTRETVEEKYITRTELDIEGNTLKVFDAKGRLVMRYYYSMAEPEEDEESNRKDTHLIHQASMEAGERWILRDVAGNPMRLWDSRGHTIRTEYDELRRPMRVYVRGVDPEDPEREILTEWILYGEVHPEAEERNLRTHIYLHLDQAGALTNERFDFKENLLESERRLARDYKGLLDWQELNLEELEEENFTTRTRYDALNRPVEVRTPDGSIIRYHYNEAGLLERVEAHLGGSATATTFIENIDYNAKGQWERIAYGNGVVTTYEYDPRTFRLIRLRTTRSGGSEVLQDLHYTYDPAGNITRIRDDAQQTIYFRNSVVEPHTEYTYDALYRLTEAKGREHIGQHSEPAPASWDDAPRVHLPHPNDGSAMRRYTERYEYDEVGNILKMIHRAEGGSWTREYFYEEPSLLEVDKTSNRLSRTKVGDITGRYTHDAHGNMTAMPHLPLMRWDYRDQLQATARQVRTGGGIPETTYYTYNANGQRVRKVTERQAPAGGNPTRMKERIYIGGFEVYREYAEDGNTVTLERQTLHIMDGENRIAIVETRTIGNDPAPRQLIRYQMGNHLGSVSLELDQDARIISYEEYYPYGATSYQAVKNQTETPKRYRYTGMERDEESGLNYHTARYYAPWLGRWVSGDPAGLVDSTNHYSYCSGEPVNYSDKAGTQRRIILRGPGLGPQSTLEDLRRFAYKKGYFYSDPNNERRYYPEENRWEGGVLTPLSQLPEELQVRLWVKYNPIVEAISQASSQVRNPFISAYAINDMLLRERYKRNLRQIELEGLRALDNARSEREMRNIGERAVRNRNKIRRRFQGRLSPGGRALSRGIERQMGFSQIEDMSRSRLPSREVRRLYNNRIVGLMDPLRFRGQQFPADSYREVIRRMVVRAGSSNPGVTLVSRVSGVFSLIGLTIGTVTLAEDFERFINDPERGGRTFLANFESMLFGFLGSQLGMIGAAVLAGLLGLTGGPALLLGIVFGFGGALLFGYFGGKFGEFAFDYLVH